jgi:hypothetical protein
LKKVLVNSESQEDNDSDVLDHYRFICLIRNQFLTNKPFHFNLKDKNNNDLPVKQLPNELQNDYFKKTFEAMQYHYKELMETLDKLSEESESITNIYKSNV